MRVLSILTVTTFLAVLGTSAAVFRRESSENGQNQGQPATKTAKTILYIRHPESTWNAIANRTFKNIAKQLGCKASSCPEYQVYKDAPLSKGGTKQLTEMYDHLSKAKMENGGTLSELDYSCNQRYAVVSSCLKRSATVSIVANEVRNSFIGDNQFNGCPKPIFYVLDSLQEDIADNFIYAKCSLNKENAEENIDADEWFNWFSSSTTLDLIEQSGSSINAKLQLSNMMSNQNYFNSRFAKFEDGDPDYDSNSHKYRTPGLKFERFLKFIDETDVDLFIVGAHSIWFRNFMGHLANETFCDASAMQCKQYAGDKEKLENTQIVKFTYDGENICGCNANYYRPQ